MQKADTHIKKIFNIISHKEMPIKVVRGYHYTPTRIAKIKKKKIVTIPNGGKAVEKLDVSHIVGKNVK